MSDNIMDFSERCRLCIEPKRLSIDIFSEEGRRIKLKSKINKNLPLKVSQSDGLPNQICYQCLFRLETWVSFKQLCMERDQVMKTWSQSYLDESCKRKETCSEVQRKKNGKVRESAPSRISKPHPMSRETDASNDAFSCNNHIDDAKSDTSLWEVVKMDDTENMECESGQKDISASLVNNVNSDADCSLPENNTDEMHEWNRRKARKPSKVPSSGSDTSISNDLDTSCTDLLVEPLVTSASSSPSQKESSNSQRPFQANKSPPLLKRKRGRPSKAFLQRERELKKIKEVKGTVNTDSDVTNGQGNEMDESTTNENEKDVDNESISGEFKPTHNLLPRPVTPEFTPVERDDGSGVTKVVLDDPDFGSMKFTLSVLGIGSPTSSPVPTDVYKYDNYAASSGNLSSDSLHREDFVGFESPCSSIFLKPMKDDVDALLDEIPRSRSQADVRFIDSDENLSPSTKRKRSNSVSCDLREKCVPLAGMSDAQCKETEGNNIPIPPSSSSLVIHNLSKSMDCISTLGENGSQCSREYEDRNAYSDGEMAHFPNKKLKGKLPLDKH